MNLLKKIHIELKVLFISTTIFWIEFYNFAFGRVVNYFSPCVQDPQSSLPCFMNYDVKVMVVMLLISALVTLVLMYKAVRSVIKRLYGL